MTVSLLAPNPSQQFVVVSGAKYTADANNIIGAVASSDVIDLMKSGCLPLPGSVTGRNNLAATADPGVSNDSTQDYAPGAVWVNTTTSRVWMCLSAAAGAAVWLLDGVVPGVGIEPSSMLTYFGGGVATFPEEGNINRQIANPVGQNGADTTMDVMATYTLPASSFDVSGRGLQITAQGSFAANANNKRVQLTAGGQIVYDTGVVATNGGGWSLSAQLFKYGAAGSNTQYAQGMGIAGAVHQGINAPAFLTLNEAATIAIQCLGGSTTTGAAGDVKCTWLEINAMN